MLDIVLNEKKVIDEALIKKVIDEKPSVTLKVLVKYYYLQGMRDKNIIKEQLIYFMNENYKGFTRSKWEDTISKMVKKFLTDTYKYKTKVILTDVENININESELEKIKELKDRNLEKIFFIALVYAKISNKINNNEDGWISKTCSTILKEAKINLRGEEKQRIFHKLYQLEYISQSSATEKMSMKVNYIDEDSETVLTITDFSGVIYYYLNEIGESWKKCEICNKWIQQKSKKPLRYCRKCAKEINKQKTSERSNALKI